MFINLKLEKNVIQNKRLITPEIILATVSSFLREYLGNATEGIARLFAEQQFTITCFSLL